MIVWEIVLKFPINWIIAPIAYLFRERAQSKKNWLWLFLSDDNMYGDTDWKPNLKNKTIRAILWMYRNPLVNRHFKDVVSGREVKFKGQVKVKYGKDIASWRTMIALDTKNWHGKIPNFEGRLLGYQDITFKRIDDKGNIQECYRKSKCVPFKFLWWIVFWKTRKGHERGMMTYGFGLPIFRYKQFEKQYKKWKEKEWKTIKV